MALSAFVQILELVARALNIGGRNEKWGRAGVPCLNMDDGASDLQARVIGQFPPRAPVV